MYQKKIVALSMAHAPKGDGGWLSAGKGIVAGASAGVLELMVFHPVDTCTKRLMTNKGKVTDLASLNQVLFRSAANLGPFGKAKSLFPGIGFAAVYKITQRAYKFGLQPTVLRFIDGINGPKDGSKPSRSQKSFNSALAGSIMGMGEVALLPFDVLKIKAQTNPDVLKGRGMFEMFRTENFKL